MRTITTMDQAQSSSTTPITTENLSRLPTPLSRSDCVEDLITRIEDWRLKVLIDVLQASQEQTTAYPYEPYDWGCVIE